MVKKISIVLIILLCFAAIVYGVPKELDSDSDNELDVSLIPVEVVFNTEIDTEAKLESVIGFAILTEAEATAAYQPLEATLTDIADGTIAEDLDNSANPWSDAEVANDITLTNITQITNKSHTNLSDVGTNTHAQVDTHISAANPHSGSQATLSNEAGLEAALSDVVNVYTENDTVILFCLSIASPADATHDDIKIKMPTDHTITAVYADCTAGTSVVFALKEVDADGDDSDAVQYDSGDYTVTCGTQLSDTSITVNNAGQANDWLQLDIGTVTGTVDTFNLSVWGKRE